MRVPGIEGFGWNADTLVALFIAEAREELIVLEVAPPHVLAAERRRGRGRRQIAETGTVDGIFRVVLQSRVVR